MSTTTTTETTGAEDHAAKPGMPQLDQTTWAPQLFWVAVTFFALYIVVSRIVIPKTGGVIAKRKSTIDGDLTEARRLKTETDAAIATYEKALADSRAKANAIALENRAKVSAEVDGERHKLDEALNARIADAEKQVQAAKTKAMQDVEAVAADIATSIVGELTGAKVSRADVEGAVARAAK